jgi:hypothetical protein
MSSILAETIQTSNPTTTSVISGASNFTALGIETVMSGLNVYLYLKAFGYTDKTVPDVKIPYINMKVSPAILYATTAGAAVLGESLVTRVILPFAVKEWYEKNYDKYLAFTPLITAGVGVGLSYGMLWVDDSAQALAQTITGQAFTDNYMRYVKDGMVFGFSHLLAKTEADWIQRIMKGDYSISK